MIDKDKIIGHIQSRTKLSGGIVSPFASIGGEVGRSGTSGNAKFVIIENSSELPEYLTERDRRMYFSVEDEQFFLWNGTEWVDEMASLTEEQMLTLKNML